MLTLVPRCAPAGRETRRARASELVLQLPLLYVDVSGGLVSWLLLGGACEDDDAVERTLALRESAWPSLDLASVDTEGSKRSGSPLSHSSAASKVVSAHLQICVSSFQRTRFSGGLTVLLRMRPPSCRTSWRMRGSWAWPAAVP